MGSASELPGLLLPRSEALARSARSAAARRGQESADLPSSEADALKAGRRGSQELHLNQKAAATMIVLTSVITQYCECIKHGFAYPSHRYQLSPNVTDAKIE